MSAPGAMRNTWSALCGATPSASLGSLSLPNLHHTLGCMHGAGCFAGYRPLSSTFGRLGDFFCAGSRCSCSPLCAVYAMEQPQPLEHACELRMHGMHHFCTPRRGRSAGRPAGRTPEPGTNRGGGPAVAAPHYCARHATSSALCAIIANAALIAAHTTTYRTSRASRVTVGLVVGLAPQWSVFEARQSY